MKKIIAGFGLAALSCTAAANADEPSPLFAKGRLVLDVLGADVPLGQSTPYYRGYAGPLTLSSEHDSSGPGGASTTLSAYGIEPSLDYFVTEHVTIGGRLGVAWEESHTYDPGATAGYTHYFAHGITGDIEPRIGYAIPFTRTFGFWPRVGAGVTGNHLLTSGAYVNSHGELVQANFGLVARVTTHVLLEFGPVLTYRVDSSGDFESTSLETSARTSFRVDF